MARFTVTVVCASLFATSWLAGPHGERRAAADVATAERKPQAAETPPSEDDPLFHCKDHPARVMVTFKADTEVKDLLAWVMGFTCKTFLLDPRVVATGRKVSVLAPLPMTPAEAYEVFLDALAAMNLTAVTHGKTVRIVDAPTAKKEVVPLIRSGSPADIEQFVRYVYRPSYVAVEQLQQAFTALKSEAGDTFTLGRILVITDYASHVRDMLAFARLVDVPGESDGIYTLPVQHADAAKLSEKLTAILIPPAGGGGSAQRPGPIGAGGAAAGGAAGASAADAGRSDAAAVPSKIVVDERSNTLILAASEPAYQRVKALVERLDVALEVDGGNAIHVYPLGSAIADELAKTLTAALGDGRSAARTSSPGASSSPTSPGASSLPLTSPNASSPSPAGSPLGGAAASGAGGLGGLASIEGQVRVIADPPTNALIILSSARDFLAIRDVIQQLDQPRRQVYVEVVILELESGNDRNLGTASHGGDLSDSGSVLFGGVKTQDANTLSVLQSLQTMTGGFAGVAGPMVTLFGQSVPSYAVLFQALDDQTHSNIVSSQSFVAVDNVDAKFKVGTRRPVNKGTILTPFGGTAAAEPRIDFPEFPLTLDIKPHISSDDQVLLEVKHEAEELTGQTAQGPTSNTRSLDTRVVVHDQETVVLSGLSQDKESIHTSKIPLLGDIPILGYLFKTTSRSMLKTNLLILLTPYIIRDRRDFQAIRERRLREHDEFARSSAALAHTRFLPDIDYRKKRGVIEDINRAVQDVEADAAARAAVSHGPRGVTPGRVDIAPVPASPAPPPP